jgi:hypothetical protein
MDKNMSEEPQLPEAELARVADGSLDAAHEAEVRRRLERSPDLTAALGEQERVVAMLRSIDVQAPASLRAALPEQLPPADRSRSRRSRRRFGHLVPVGVALAAALVIVLVTDGSATGPSLQQTVRLTLAAATYPAPGERTASALDHTAAGIAFPYWQQSVGWRAVGARADRIGGREIVTVFYGRPGGHRVGYAIVGGPALPVSGGRTVTRGGVPYYFLRQGSARLVTWLRSGHTCVIAGRRVTEATLLALATTDVRQ